MRELMKNGCPNQASKQLKPNGQMERMVKMMKKEGWKKIHYFHPIENHTW